MTSSDPPQTDPQAPVKREVALGAALATSINLAISGLLYGSVLGLGLSVDGPAAVPFFAWTMGASVLQTVYLLPLFLWLRPRRPAMASGVVIGASLTLLFQTACYGFVFASAS